MIVKERSKMAELRIKLAKSEAARRVIEGKVKNKGALLKVV